MRGEDPLFLITICPQSRVLLKEEVNQEDVRSGRFPWQMPPSIVPELCVSPPPPLLLAVLAGSSSTLKPFMRDDCTEIYGRIYKSYILCRIFARIKR